MGSETSPTSPLYRYRTRSILCSQWPVFLSRQLEGGYYLGEGQRGSFVGSTNGDYHPTPCVTYKTCRLYLLLSRHKIQSLSKSLCGATSICSMIPVSSHYFFCLFLFSFFPNQRPLFEKRLIIVDFHPKYSPILTQVLTLGLLLLLLLLLLPPG